jgi:hypothetical protein
MGDNNQQIPRKRTFCSDLYEQIVYVAAVLACLPQRYGPARLRLDCSWHGGRLFRGG